MPSRRHNQKVDRGQFERLANRHKDSVYRQMLRVCNHREDAEDALAEALSAAYQAMDQLESDEAFRGWLGTIARRVCLRMRTRPAFQTLLEEHASATSADTGADGLSTHMMKRCVSDAVRSLRPIYRDIYLLCELEEVTVPAAAAQIGISVAAAKARLLRARALVRTHLDSSLCGTLQPTS